ncbi:S-layer family protein [Leptolyngbya sp. NK1-12]|uniref:S-layer family protein n=1 Tax=Leptolyngbya sp. NK1-12 TaxID=2547451 RepID=A0AA97AGQ7_9CYAN|nr:S-layer family protein [Leptolyngbya sp. NK1-12]WNZ23729.1 S-layer family protein [Leptolyngbya sp. NK1-12]
MNWPARLLICYRPLLGLGSVLFGLAGGFAVSAPARIVPDQSLPRPSVTTPRERTTVITGGTQRGRNLFHSFREFSVPNGGAASFQQVDPAVTNIFSRVTGSARSRINGLIEVREIGGSISRANFFLINPNGIVFGPNATLNMGGSFMATTADRINFADGTQFSAIAPQTTPLLTVSVPVGLQFGNRLGSIASYSYAQAIDETGNPRLTASGETVFGLNVPAGQTLALVGGDLVIAAESPDAPAGILSTEGGRIELGSVASAGEVRLSPNDLGWALGYNDIRSFGSIRLGKDAVVDASGLRGGAIRVQGGQVSLSGESSQIYSVTYGAQQGRPIRITASDSLTMSGGLSSIRTETEGRGTAGDIEISTRHLVIRNGGRIGSITLAEGRGGNVRVNASESVLLAGVSDIYLSLLYVLSRGEGPSGNLMINTNRLQVLEGGNITSTTINTGDAGDMTIRAEDVDLAGIALDKAGNPIQLQFDEGRVPYSSGIFVGTAPGSQGRGGSLAMRTQRLRLRDGTLLQANTYGSRRAGDLDIRATESVEVTGRSENGRFRTSIAASSGGLPNVGSGVVASALGLGGDVEIRTGDLTVRDGAVVAVNSRNPAAAGAGRLSIRANRIMLDNQADLNAQTESGRNARIDLRGVDLLVLRRGSRISTEAGSSTGGGNAGRIDIDANFILNAPAENSDIVADADREDAGRIEIEAQGILGIAQRDQRTPQSDITANSRAGVDGEISISTPTVDPTRGLVELPSTVVDASRLIARGCRAEDHPVAEQSGEFVITGRGGVPPSPTDLRSSEAIITGWVSFDSEAASVRSGTPHVEADSAPSAPIAEAQTWILGTDGRVKLVAPTAAASPSPPMSVACGRGN